MIMRERERGREEEEEMEEDGARERTKKGGERG